MSWNPYSSMITQQDSRIQALTSMGLSYEQALQMIQQQDAGPSMPAVQQPDRMGNPNPQGAGPYGAQTGLDVFPLMQDQGPHDVTTQNMAQQDPAAAIQQQTGTPERPGFWQALGGLPGNPMFNMGMGLLAAGYDRRINPWQAAAGGLQQAQQFQYNQEEAKVRKEMREAQLQQTKQRADLNMRMMEYYDDAMKDGKLDSTEQNQLKRYAFELNALGGQVNWSDLFPGPTKPSAFMEQLELLAANNPGASFNELYEMYKSGTDTNITLNTAPSKTTVNALQEDFIRLGETWTNLRDIGESFADEYLTARGKLKHFAGTQAERFEIPELLEIAGQKGAADEVREWGEFAADRGVFLQDLRMFFNDYRRYITGAQAAEKELQQLISAMINEKEMGATEFKKRYNRLMRRVLTSYQIVYRNLDKGIPQPMNDLSTYEIADLEQGWADIETSLFGGTPDDLPD